MFTKENYIRNIEEVLSYLATFIKGRNASGRTDDNHAAEDFYAKFLNFVYKSSFINGNIEKQGIPAIDLIDKEKGIVIQVTSNCSIPKVKDTLDKFSKKNYEGKPYKTVFKRLVIFSITLKERHRWDSISLPDPGIEFDVQRDIWDYTNIVADLRSQNYTVKQLENITRYLNEALRPGEGKIGLSIISEQYEEIKPIRRLAENLWINWKTGCLAGDYADCDIECESDFCSSSNMSVTLSEDRLRMLSVLVQGEGAVVSWVELYQRGVVIQQETGNFERNNIDEETLKKKVEISINSLCTVSNSLAEIIKRAENGKGYRICLFGMGSQSIENVTYLESDKIENERGWSFLMPGVTEENSGGIVSYIDKKCWLRKYYDKECGEFEQSITNADGKNQGAGTFGNYKMIQIYANAYALEGVHNATKTMKEGISETKDRKITNYNLMAMLDYVEKWYHENVNRKPDEWEYGGIWEADERDEEALAEGGLNMYGNILVLHGEPGDGKTTFCKKAVYAHRYEGWMQEIPCVLRISLNPNNGRNSILFGGKLNISKALCLCECCGDNITEGDSEEKTYYCDPKNLEKGTLLILDGYDELYGQLSNERRLSSFYDFYKEVERVARYYQWNIIITSRTMCIKRELVENRMLWDKSIASFARLYDWQQEMMIDRMIELDKMSGRTLHANSLSGLNTDLRYYQNNTLPKLRENKEFEELLDIPALFRIIVTVRFRDYEQVKNSAELYISLFHALMKFKGKGEQVPCLLKEYEIRAAKIFCYNKDTYPFSNKEEYEERELVYIFFTKYDESCGRMGFLHGAFRQYFLARYIVTGLQDAKPLSEDEGEVRRGKRIFERLFLSLRSFRIEENLIWKLLVQIAQTQGTRRDGLKQKTIELHDIENGLRNLNEEIFAKGITEDYVYEAGPEAGRGIIGAVNAVSNMLSSCASMENGYHRRKYLDEGLGLEEDFILNDNGNEHARWVSYRWEHSIPYGKMDEYSNVCELLKRGSFTNSYLEGINLAGCNMSYAHMENSDLSETWLKNADFSAASLIKVNLSGANLTDSIFRSADLSQANISCALLLRADFEKAILRDSHMEHVFLSNCIDERIVEEKTVRQVSTIKGTVSFKEANLRKAMMTGAVLDGADFSHADLTGADLSGASFKGANFTGAIMKDSILRGAHLEGATFTEADLERADLSNTHLKGSHLERAHLEGAELICAQLDNAFLMGTNLDGTVLVGAVLKDAKLNNASLQGAYMDVIRLDDEKGYIGVSADGFWVDESQRMNSLLNETILDGAVLTGADCKGLFLSELQYQYVKERNTLGLPMTIPSGMLELPEELSDKEVSGLIGAQKKDGRWIIDMRIAESTYFGHYKQYMCRSKNNGKEDLDDLVGSEEWESKPLKWIVLRREYDKVLLITEKLIDCRPYNLELKSVTWENSSLREWMNGEFLYIAFNDEERERIAKVCNRNPKNIKIGTEGGRKTWDRVFALSIGEAWTYFKNDEERRMSPTPYAKSIGIHTEDVYKDSNQEATGCWWLRSPGFRSRVAAYVDLGGGVHIAGYAVDYKCISVRPALWLNL